MTQPDFLFIKIFILIRDRLNVRQEDLRGRKLYET